MKQETRALVFDAYGTLFDPHSIVSACDECFPGQGSALSQLWRAKQLEYTWLRSLMGRYEDFWKVTGEALAFACKSMGLVCDSKFRHRLMEAYLSLQVFPEARQALSSLARYPLAILSNGTPQMLQAAVGSNGLDGVFEHVLSVHEARVYKPSPLVYQLAVQKMAVEPGATGFVSSNGWDVVGAKAFGFRTYWVNRFDAAAEELGLTPDVTIGNLAELPGAL